MAGVHAAFTDFTCCTKLAQKSKETSCNIYSEPSAIGLEIIQRLDNCIKQHVKICCSQLTHTWKHLGKADESLVCSHRTGQFLQSCTVMFRHKHSFWVFCQRMCIYIYIYVLSCYNVYVKALGRCFVVCSHQHCSYIITFAIHLCSKFLFVFQSHLLLH
jgi:hypothetical protein